MHPDSRSWQLEVPHTTAAPRSLRHCEQQLESMFHVRLEGDTPTYHLLRLHRNDKRKQCVHSLTH